MSHEANEDMSATILEAEESILRIAEELGRMKTAAEYLDDAGKRSQLLQDAVENLVTEIGSLVDLSGRVIDVLNASEIKGLITQMRTVLSHRIDGLRTELLANSESSAERIRVEVQTMLAQHSESLGKEIASRNESATGRVGEELLTALIQRMNNLENEVNAGTKFATKQISAEVLAANERLMIDSDEILKRLDVLGARVAEVRDLAEKSTKRKGLLL